MSGGVASRRHSECLHPSHMQQIAGGKSAKMINRIYCILCGAKKKKKTPEEAQADKAKKGSRQQTKLPARVVIINKVIMRPSAGVGVAKSLPICHKLHLLLPPLPLLLPLLPVSYFTFCQAKFYY